MNGLERIRIEGDFNNNNNNNNNNKHKEDTP